MYILTGLVIIKWGLFFPNLDVQLETPTIFTTIEKCEKVRDQLILKVATLEKKPEKIAFYCFPAQIVE